MMAMRPFGVLAGSAAQRELGREPGREAGCEAGCEEPYCRRSAASLMSEAASAAARSHSGISRSQVRSNWALCVALSGAGVASGSEDDRAVSPPV